MRAWAGERPNDYFGFEQSGGHGGAGVMACGDDPALDQSG